jgi:hypothetical protein
VQVKNKLRVRYEYTVQIFRAPVILLSKKSLTIALM